MREEVYYVYPEARELSFNRISEFHIRELEKYVKVQRIYESVLDTIMWVPGKNVLLHPILYMLIGDRREVFNSRRKRLKRLLEVKRKLGGFEVCDTDRLSDTAVDVLNKMDLVFVPSRWAKSVVVRSGVRTSVEVLPHAIDDVFRSDSRRVTSEDLAPLVKLKREHNATFVLFFLMHSGYRKGADLVKRVMERIQEERDDVFLVVKTGRIIDPFLPPLRTLRTIHVAGWLSEDDLRQLYDLCDVCLVPSRGGGFELNALEAIARGVPTLVTEAGAFLDYINYAIPVRVGRKCRVYADNPIHIGEGYEADVEDFYKKLKDVIDHLGKYRRKFAKYAKAVREKYTWERTGKMLYEYLCEYGFIRGEKRGLPNSKGGPSKRGQKKRVGLFAHFSRRF